MKTAEIISSIFQILEILEKGSTDRKRLSEHLGIGLSDTGKLVSFMLSESIIKEYTKTSRTPGRRTGILIPQSEPIFAIAHIFYDKITTDFFGYGLKITEHNVHDIDDHLFIDDVFTSYFRDLSLRRPSICGICLVCDGFADNGVFKGSSLPGLSDLPLAAIAEDHLPKTQVTLENRYARCLSESSALDVIITDEYCLPRSYIIYNGEIIRGKCSSAGILDRFHDISVRRNTAALIYARNTNDYVSAFARIFCDVITLLSPERIIFKSGRYSRSDEIILRISEKLLVDFMIPISSLPEFITEGERFDLSLSSLRRSVRNNYVSDNLCPRSEKLF